MTMPQIIDCIAKLVSRLAFIIHNSFITLSIRMKMTNSFIDVVLKLKNKFVFLQFLDHLRKRSRSQNLNAIFLSLQPPQRSSNLRFVHFYVYTPKNIYINRMCHDRPTKSNIYTHCKNVVDTL